jgi:hypothetical protein
MQTDGGAAAAAGTAPAISGRMVSRLVVVGAITFGWLVALYTYHWRLSASSFFLLTGWLALVLAARLLWTAFAAAAAPDVAEPILVTRGRDGDLQREKRALLRAIKDVEFDRDMGKMAEPEAEEIVRIYRARAIQIIRELEQLRGGAAGEADELDAIIEREVAARLGDRAAARAAAGQPRESGADPAAGPSCAACGIANDADAAFCKKCGAKLAPAEGGA